MNVFKKSLFSLLLFVGSYNCFAQEISIRGGLNLARFVYENHDGKIDYDGIKSLSGFNFGPILELPLKGKFSFETGILATTKGRKITGTNEYLFKDNLLYLEIPALLKAYFSLKNARVFGVAGPYAGGAIYGKRYGESIENNVLKKVKADIHWGNKPNEYDRFDFGLKLGIGTKINRYQFGAQYNIGLKNFSNDDDLILRHKTLEFYFAYKINVFK